MKYDENGKIVNAPVKLEVNSTKTVETIIVMTKAFPAILIIIKVVTIQTNENKAYTIEISKK